MTQVEWVRLRGRERCAICQHVGWCGYSADKSTVICMRVASDKPTRNGGWLHKLNDTTPKTMPTPAIAKRANAIRTADLSLLMGNYRTAVNPVRLSKLCKTLEISEIKIKLLDIGWAHDKDAWAFPMTNSKAQIIGIRLRTNDGKKFSVKGGKEGLFVPTELSGSDPLIICEGPTSCAALLDLGFDAIGRPSCSGGVTLTRDWLRRHGRRDVVIFGDHDSPKPLPNGKTFQPGQEGAERLAAEILPVCRSLKIVVPPRHKDARDWKKAGATKQTIEAVIQAMNYVRRAS